jgi:hypothetical protein
VRFRLAGRMPHCAGSDRYAARYDSPSAPLRTLTRASSTSSPYSTRAPKLLFGHFAPDEFVLNGAPPAWRCGCGSARPSPGTPSCAGCAEHAAAHRQPAARAAGHTGITAWVQTQPRPDRGARRAQAWSGPRDYRRDMPPGGVARLGEDRRPRWGCAARRTSAALAGAGAESHGSRAVGTAWLARPISTICTRWTAGRRDWPGPGEVERPGNHLDAHRASPVRHSLPGLGQAILEWQVAAPWYGQGGRRAQVRACRHRFPRAAPLQLPSGCSSATHRDSRTSLSAGRGRRWSSGLLQPMFGAVHRRTRSAPPASSGMLAAGGG